MDPGSPRDDRLLRWAAIVFAVASAVHIVDHLRRGQGSITDTLLVLGNAALVLQVVTVTLVLVRHRWAPLVALVVGTQLAIGFAAAHWLPEWSAMSDPVWEIDDGAWFSALASGAEVAGAVLVAVAGGRIVRHRGLRSFAG